MFLPAPSTPSMAEAARFLRTSTDPQAVLPANYPFTAANDGTHTFTVTFKTSGSQAITATDTGGWVAALISCRGAAPGREGGLGGGHGPVELGHGGAGTVELFLGGGRIDHLHGQIAVFQASVDQEFQGGHRVVLQDSFAGVLAAIARPPNRWMVPIGLTGS